jgi:hypothetical protein
MTVYAIFMCLITAHAGVGHNCIFMADKPFASTRSITTLAECQHQFWLFRAHVLPGYKLVCMKQTVPAWSPAN